MLRSLVGSEMCIRDSQYTDGFQYYDLQVDDKQLTKLNAEDALKNKAKIIENNKVVNIEIFGDFWKTSLEDGQIIKSKVLINASAIGFYGSHPQTEFTEENIQGDDFLANLCKEWESIAKNKPRATRLLIVRIGIVLAKDGGALGKMLPIFRAGLGGPIGDGKQWMSWIHRTDLCNLINESVKNSAWSGVVNGVAPNPVRMNEFSNSLGQVLGRPSLFAVPGPILKLILGDGARVVLEGQNVKPQRLNKLLSLIHI